jgi:3-oxoacyl-[acyl-carrier protein] reductase
MQLQLEERVVVVTGASRGIGLAIAHAFARERTRLVVCARHEPALREAADALAAAGAAAVRALPLDVTAPHAAPALLQAAVELGGPDVLVSNAGGNRRKPFVDTTDADWLELLELNLLSGLRLARAALPLMRARGRGSILFIGSIWGRETGGDGYTLYNASKSALISAARVMAREVAADGVRVNSIAPGSILAPGGSWERRQQQDPDGIAEFVRRELPLHRFGTAAEVADLAVFLASDRASLITGACIAADGGQGRSLI